MALTHSFTRGLVLLALASLLLALWLMFMGAPPVRSAPAFTTIQAAINAASPGGTVLIPAGTYTESLTVNKSLTLTGALSSTTIIHAAGGQRVITVTTGSDLRLENLTITGGFAGLQDGGGIAVLDGNLTVISSRISNNSGNHGGGIYEGSCWYGTASCDKRVDIIGSILELNKADTSGGGLFASGSAALTNTQVLSNRAGYGGGVEIWDGRMDLLGGIFQGNTAESDGGGVNLNNSISVNGTQFISNTSVTNGGGIHQWNTAGNPPVTIVNARFEQNASGTKGGGLRAGGPTTITASLFLSNSVYAPLGTETYGGGAHISNTLYISASTFTGNSATCTSCGYTYGGGVSLQGANTSAVIENSIFEEGYAWEGSGVYRDMYTPGSVTVHRSVFRDNSAGYGGGIYSFDAQVDNSDFLRNTVQARGGGLIAQTATLTATRFISNTSGTGMSDKGGGGMEIDDHVDGTNLLFAENKSEDNTAGDDVLYSGWVTPGSLRHVTIAHPTMGTGPAILVQSGTLSLTNSIIVSHTVGISQTGGTVNADYDLFFGGTSTQSGGGTMNLGAHNITGQNPKFVNAASGDYHLAAGSPAIDVGTNAGVTADLEDTPRPQGAGYDLGAYEYIVKQAQTILFSPIPNKRVTDPPFAVAPTASSGLPVTLTASGACSVSGFTVTLTHVGTCSLTAHQVGNKFYYAAPDVTRSFSVTYGLNLPLVMR